MNAAFLLWEKNHRRPPSFYSFSVLATNARECGCEVSTHIIDASTHDLAFPDSITEKSDLLVLDSSCPIDLSRALQRMTGAPIVWTGENALGRLERTNTPFAFVHPDADDLVHLCQVARTNRLHLRSTDSDQDPSESSRFYDRLAALPELYFRRFDINVDEDASHPIDGSSEEIKVARPADPVPQSSIVQWKRLSSPHRDSTDSTAMVELILPEERRGQARIAESDAAVSGNELVSTRYTPRGRARLAASLRSAPSDGASPSLFRPERSVEELGRLLRDRILWLWPLGIRTFSIRASRPFSIYRALLDSLADHESRPAEIQIQGDVRDLKDEEPIIRDVLTQAARSGINTRLNGFPFDSFVPRCLGMLDRKVTHWDNRRGARSLAQLDGLESGKVRSLEGHQLLLFDPWTTLDELLENLQAIEEDAPFLKDTVHLDSIMEIQSVHTDLAHRIHQAGLLRETPTGSGWTFEFRDPQVRLFRDLAARGTAPLMEAIGRMRLRPEAREGMVREGRFRWFRELALFLQREAGSGRKAEDGWGQILSAVAGDLGFDPTPGP